MIQYILGNKRTIAPYIFNSAVTISGRAVTIG